jgi:hypothetical protein
MSGSSLVEFVERWQTGFFVVIGVAVVGVLSGLAVRSVAGAPGFFAGFLGGSVLAFLAYSYLRYGRSGTG